MPSVSKYEGERDTSLLGLIINGAGNIVISVDASTTVDTLFLLIPDKYAHSCTSFAFAVSLYTNLLPVVIRLFGMAVPTFTAAAASTSACLGALHSLRMRVSVVVSNYAIDSIH